MDWENVFKKIEQALGFELYDWQKDYISMKIDSIPVGGRRNGKTVAYIVRHLLNYEVKLGEYVDVFKWRNGYFPCDRFTSFQYTHYWYPQLVMDIDCKLKSVGLDTCFL